MRQSATSYALCRSWENGGGVCEGERWCERASVRASERAASETGGTENTVTFPFVWRSWLARRLYSRGLFTRCETGEGPQFDPGREYFFLRQQRTSMHLPST